MTRKLRNSEPCSHACEVVLVSKGANGYVAGRQSQTARRLRDRGPLDLSVPLLKLRAQRLGCPQTWLAGREWATAGSSTLSGMGRIPGSTS